MIVVVALAILMALARLLMARLRLSNPLEGLSGVSADIDGVKILFDLVTIQPLDHVRGWYEVHDQTVVQVEWTHIAAPIALTSALTALFLYYKAGRRRRGRASASANPPIRSPEPQQSGEAERV
jgi:hypothetical protein